MGLAEILQLIFPFLGFAFDSFNLGQADDRALERTNQAIEGLEQSQVSPQELINAAGIPGVSLNGNLFGSGDGLLNLNDAFQSFDVFSDMFEPFQSVQPGATGFDQNDLRAFGAGINQNLRQTGQNIFSQLTANPADFSGVLERIEGRFPDTEAFERSRLSGISEQAQQNTTRQRRNVVANFGGDLQAASGDLERVSFDVGQNAGRQGNIVSAEAENIKRQQAAQLGNIDQALAQAEASDLTTRTLAGGQALLSTSLAGADIFARLFGQGESLGLQANMFDIGNQFQADILNQTIPFDQAQISANIRSGQDIQQIQTLLSLLGMRSGLTGQAAGLNAGTQQQMAQLLAGYSENVPLITPIMQQTFAGYFGGGNSGGPKDGFSGSFLGTGGGYSCVHGSAMLETPDGPTAMCDIREGDSVRAADGEFKKVVKRDFGLLPEDKRDEKHIEIRTRDRRIVITRDHPIGGRQAKDWHVGDLIPVEQDSNEKAVREKITNVLEHPYVVSGDLMLEGNADYVADGFIVKSVLGLIEMAKTGTRVMDRFITMPMTLIDSLDDPVAHQERFWKYSAGGEDDEFARIEKESGAVSLAEATERANSFLRERHLEPDAEFIKEGHTSAVFLSKANKIVLNVARDTKAAADDLLNGFTALQNRQSRMMSNVAHVRVIDADGIPVVATEFVPDALEITLDDGRVGVIERFNGLFEPQIRWLDEDESTRVIGDIFEIEHRLGVGIECAHGDAVLTKDGKVVIVACNDPTKKHFVAYETIGGQLCH